MLVRRPSSVLRPLLAAVLLAALPVGGPARASPEEAGRRAPIWRERTVSQHAPFVAGECGACHRAGSRPSPATVVKPLPGLCLDCHDDFHTSVSRAVERATARVSCTSCHTPHNSANAKLLLYPGGLPAGSGASDSTGALATTAAAVPKAVLVDLGDATGGRRLPGADEAAAPPRRLR
jgi:predicted CXXCH cytochrome family protein